MPIFWNPFRLYKGRVAWEHGLLVEILRNTESFWDAYTDLLSLNGKRESDIKELHHVMRQMGLAPKPELKNREVKKRQVLIKLDAEFSASLKRLESMFSVLRTIIIDDETLMYRTFVELKDIYMRLGSIHHPPNYMMAGMLGRFHTLIAHMVNVQEHAWNVSKAHSRGFTKLAELTIVSSRGERRRIRRQTIELDHLRNRIEPLREWVERLRYVKSHEDIHLLHERINEILELYHAELSDLESILQEADVLVRRTENLFKAIEHEAKELRERSLEKKMHSYAGSFHKIVTKIEAQSRRETLDMKHIFERLPKPESFHKEQREAEVISMEQYRKQHEQLKKAA